jgi:hypothetical protein
MRIDAALREDPFGLHAADKLWQDRGRLCVRGSQFAAEPPGK